MYKNANVVAMNLLTVRLCETNAMIMLIDSIRTADWPNGLAWKQIKKLCVKCKPSDTIVSAEQLEKLMKLKLKKKQDQEYLECKIASLNTNYGCQIGEDLKIADIVNAVGCQYSDKICSKTKAIKRADSSVTSADLIHAMMESFRIYQADSDMSYSKDKVIATLHHLTLIVIYVKRADTRQGTVPSVPSSNANTVVDWDTRKRHARN
jgi:hypothetical protein